MQTQKKLNIAASSLAIVAGTVDGIRTRKRKRESHTERPIQTTAKLKQMMKPDKTPIEMLFYTQETSQTQKYPGLLEESRQEQKITKTEKFSIRDSIQSMPWRIKKKYCKKQPSGNWTLDFDTEQPDTFNDFFLTRIVSGNFQATNTFIESDLQEWFTKMNGQAVEYEVAEFTVPAWSIEDLPRAAYYAIMVANQKELVGMATVDANETLDNPPPDWVTVPKKDGAPPLYIAAVNIKDTYQGRGVCTQLVKYVIGELKKRNHTRLFIQNASKTLDGLPACKCYSKAGLENGYCMRYWSEHNQTWQQMEKPSFCNTVSTVEIRTTYIYDLAVTPGQWRLKNA
jgi:GNAT superfamily N-acetyltransferase